MLNLITLKPFDNEVDVTTDECIDCQLNHDDLPSNSMGEFEDMEEFVEDGDEIIEEDY